MTLIELKLIECEIHKIKHKIMGKSQSKRKKKTKTKYENPLSILMHATKYNDFVFRKVHTYKSYNV